MKSPTEIAALEAKMNFKPTWSDLVRWIWGWDTSEEEIKILLWECSCFPAGSAQNGT